MLTDFVGTQRVGIPLSRAIPFTFPDSGITVGLYRLAPDTITLIRQAIKKEFSPPQPPTQTVEFADGTSRQERNEADPEYTAALKRYEYEAAEKTADRMMRLIARRAEVEVDNEAVFHFRADMEAIGVPVEETDDKAVYVRHICVSSEGDYTALTDFIMQRSQPTKEAVDAHKDSFRGDVPGA